MLRLLWPNHTVLVTAARLRFGINLLQRCDKTEEEIGRIAKRRKNGYIRGVEFDWDPKKEAKNLRKHKVAFSEAATVFRDTLSTTGPDPDHSDEEDRYLIVGLSYRQRLLIVSHAEDGDWIQIISARELTRAEKKSYEEER